MAFPEVLSQQESSFNDPIRVRVSEFFITLTPAQQNMTTIEAEKIRDAAEDLFEDYLLTVDWSTSTLYDYAGLAGIETVFVDDTRTPPVTVIKVRGGLVVFGGDTTVVPAENEIEAMLRASLYPDSLDDISLTDLLNVLGDFGVVESSTYEAIRSPTPSQMPSQMPSSPVPQTYHPSSEPTSLAPTFTPSRAPESPSPSLTTSRQPSVFDVATEPPSPSPTQMTTSSSSAPVTTAPIELRLDPTEYPSPSPSIVTTSPTFAPITTAPIELQPSPTEPPSPSPSLVITSPTFAPVTAAPDEEQPKPIEAPSLGPSRLTASPSYAPATAVPIDEQLPSQASSYPLSSQPTLLDQAIDPSSSLPTLPDSSSAQASQNPSSAATFDEDVSQLSNGKQASLDASSAGADRGIIGGAIGAFLVVSLVAMLFFVSRRGKRQQVWKAGVNREFPDDDLEDSGLHKKDHLREHGVTDGKSETGSSILGRLRMAASVAPQRNLLNDSPDTTPQSSSGSAGENSFENGGIEIALASSSLAENKFAETSFGDQSEHVSLFPALDQSVPVAWSNMSLVQPIECAITPTDSAAAVMFDRWSDCSTNQEIETNPEGSDTDGNFTLSDGDAWDFEDNEDDEGEADPFSTPAYFSGADKVTLLGAIVERSSTMSPGGV